MKKVKLGIYPRYLYLTTDLDEFQKHIDGNFDGKVSSAGTAGYVSNKKKYDCGVIIYFEEDELKKEDVVKLIAHESLHAVSCIFYDLGIDYDKENDEPAAYLIGFIAGECDKFIKKQLGNG